MSWSELGPVLDAKNKKSAVLVSATGQGGRFRNFLKLSFSWGELDLPWLKPGCSVKVMLGAGENAGQIRVSENGPHILRRPGGHATTRTTLILTALPSQSPQKFSSTNAEHRIEGGALFVPLPAWAFAKTVQIAPAQICGEAYKMGAPSHADVLKQARSPK